MAALIGPVVGALVPGWMAWRLSREMNSAPTPRETETSQK
jgi:hypothetical protein